MRVNVYGEELTTKVEIVKKAVDQRTFIAVRFYLESTTKLHHGVDDNDESAVTFWAKWTKENGNDLEGLYEMFYNAIQELSKIKASGEKLSK
jgi:hypothetical protein